MNKKIRILTVIRHSAGGIRTYLKYTYNHLDKSKYHFTILAVKSEESKQLKQDLEGLFPVFIEVDEFGLSFFYRLFKLLLKRDAHVIHSQGSLSGIFVSFMNLVFGIPHIITFHGTFENENFKGRFMILKKKIMLFLLSRANFINVVSEDAKANLIKHFPGLSRHPTKIVVIENGIDVDFFMEEVESQKSIFDIEGIDEDSYVIAFLGRYMPEKGFHVLIDAIEILAKSPDIIKNVRVLALGWGAFIREYQALIREKGLTGYFVFIEFQSDVRWVLKQADILAIPSLREAFGLVAGEGLVSGIPIIASDCIGLREVLRDTPAHLVKAGNPRELADAIIEAIKNPKKQETVNFIPEAMKRFDVAVASSKLDSLFEKVVG